MQSSQVPESSMQFQETYYSPGDYNSEELLAELTRVMARTIDLEAMTHAILSILTKNMRISRAAFLIVDGHTVSDVKCVSTSGKSYLIDSKTFDILKEYFHQEINRGVTVFVFRDMEEGRYKDIFRQLGVSIAIPIHSKDDAVAILLLDKKLSGEIYSLRDTHFLSTFAAESGIAIQNAKSYEQVKKFSEELEKKVQMRTKELKEAQEREIRKAQDVARLKDEFVFIATHELRAPITAIRLFLEMMPTKEDFFPKDIQEKLNSISSASEHLNQLINDLLQIARSEAGTMKMVVEPIDIISVIKKQLEEQDSLVQKRGIKVSFKHAVATPRVQADRQRVTEVVTNLINNAIKYNREEGLISISVLEQGGNVIVEIRDTGFGIPAEQQGKIFQKFFRASNKDTLNVLGTGLGLFITRMLVEKMGGSITFTSVQGEGTTFAFLLPKEDFKSDINS